MNKNKNADRLFLENQWWAKNARKTFIYEQQKRSKHVASCRTCVQKKRLKNVQTTLGEAEPRDVGGNMIWSSRATEALTL